MLNQTWLRLRSGNYYILEGGSSLIPNQTWAREATDTLCQTKLKGESSWADSEVHSFAHAQCYVFSTLNDVSVYLGVYLGLWNISEKITFVFGGLRFVIIFVDYYFFPSKKVLALWAIPKKIKLKKCFSKTYKTTYTVGDPFGCGTWGYWRITLEFSTRNYYSIYIYILQY